MDLIIVKLIKSSLNLQSLSTSRTYRDRFIWDFAVSKYSGSINPLESLGFPWISSSVSSYVGRLPCEPPSANRTDRISDGGSKSEALIDV